MSVSLPTLILIPAVAVVAVLLVTSLSPIVKIPLVVFEIVLGILIGPSILGWVDPSGFASAMADLGLVILFFMAGHEIDFVQIKGRPLTRAGLGWLISIAAGLLLGLAVAPSRIDAVYLGIALSSTALGTLMPILRDARELATPFGRAVTAVGAAGEFGPLLAISLFLSGRRPGAATVVLLGFGLVSAIAVWLAAMGTHPHIRRVIDATMHSSAQFAVRLVVLLMALLAGLSIWLRIDMLLGAFAAGVVFRLLLAEAEPETRELIDTKLEAVAFGFLVPIFFINTGITFDLDKLLGDVKALLLLPVFLVMLLVVRGVPGSLAAPPGATASDRRAMILLSATALPIIVAVTDIGVDHGDLDPALAASLVGAGMLSVLLFPLFALAQRHRTAAPIATVPWEVGRPHRK
jgi:Kef-type K+ transport system membrane component KefB